MVDIGKIKIPFYNKKGDARWAELEGTSGFCSEVLKGWALGFKPNSHPKKVKDKDPDKQQCYCPKFFIFFIIFDQLLIRCYYKKKCNKKESK